MVTVFLNGYGLKHGMVEEHLSDYLNEGWRIVSANAAGGSSGAQIATVWVVVVLERNSGLG